MSDIKVPRLAIGAEIMQEAAEAASFLLKVPERARKTAKTAFWTELFDIAATDMSMVEEVDSPEKVGRIKVVVDLKVPADSEFPENVGRTLKINWLLNPTAPAKSKERMMHILALGRIRGLLLSCGVDVDAGVDDLRTYFIDNETEGTESAIKNMRFFGVVKEYTDKQGVKRNDVISFDNLEAGGKNL